MRIEIGKSYAVRKDSVLYPYWKSITVTNIIKSNDEEFFYNTKEGFTLFSSGQGYHTDRWDIDKVAKIMTLKEERKVKLDKLNKGRWWKIW